MTGIGKEITHQNFRVLVEGFIGLRVITIHTTNKLSHQSLSHIIIDLQLCQYAKKIIFYSAITGVAIIGIAHTHRVATYVAAETPLDNPNNCASRFLTYDPSQSSIKSFIECEAEKYKLDKIVVNWIADNESSFCYRNGYYQPDIKGDDNNSIGCWQISKIWHPEVPTSTSEDLIKSTEWSLSYMKQNGFWEWSTYRFCKKWYKNCPIQNIVK